MNSLTNIIKAGVSGTSCMTLFSYITSEKKNKNFKEPKLLGKLINRLFSINKTSSIAAGWVAHYTTGIVFATLYSGILKKTKLNNTISAGIVTGGLSGIVAVAVWHTVLKLHPVRPHVKLKNYYGHLIVTHILFGAVTMILLNKKER